MNENLTTIDYCFLGCDIVWSRRLLTLQRNFLPPFSEWKNDLEEFTLKMKAAHSCGTLVMI
jgi:hypothetical protein